MTKIKQIAILLDRYKLNKPCWHNGPDSGVGQVQVKPVDDVELVMQVPLLWHGFESQGLPGTGFEAAIIGNNTT